MSRRPLSDQRHLLVELELDESVLGDARGRQVWHEPLGSPYEASHPRRQSDRLARPQSATVRRTSTSDHKNSSPFKLKQKVLSSRSRAALDIDERPSQSRRASSSTSRRREESTASTPLTLIADAIRQNILQRHQVLMEIQDELHRALALPQTRRVAGHQRAALLSSSVVKALNRLRSLTLSIVEMVRYFHEQLPPGNATGDASLWALRHEFRDCFTRLCASDVDCLLRFPPVVYLFESLGANSLRNPMLDGVSLDSSELLLCSCQSTGSATNATSSSSLFRLIVSRLEAFSIQIRQLYPSWQILPHDRVARALLDLLESETKANATRLLPSYLRSEADNSVPRPYNRRFDGAYDENDKTSSGRPQYAAASTSHMSEEDAYDDDIQDDESEPWEDTQHQTQARKPSHVWVDAPSPESPQSVSKVATPRIVSPKATETPPTKAATAPNVPMGLVAPSSAVAEPKVSPLAAPAASGAAKKAKKLHERAMTVNSLPLFPPHKQTSEVHRPLSDGKQTVAELVHAAEAKRESDDDRLRATIASALDKLPQFSLEPLGITPKNDASVAATVALSQSSARVEEELPGDEEVHVQQEIHTHDELPTVQPQLELHTERIWNAPPSERVELEHSAKDEDEDADEAVDSENASALSRILSLCRDVQVAAIDMNQRLDQSRVDQAKRSAVLAPIATVSPTVSSPRYQLSNRYLERELKMLRRFFRLWQAARIHRHERLQALRVVSAARRIGRFAKSVLARKLAARQLKECQRQELLALRIQRQWRVFRSRKQARRRQQAFHLMHRSFKRYQFFTRLMQRHRRRLQAQATLQLWWRRLSAVKKAEERRKEEHETLKRRQIQAAKQLQGFVKEQLLRSKLSKALEANRSFMMKEKLKQTRARQEDEKRLKLESKRRAEMRAVMQQSLREMESRWKEAEAAKELLREETARRQEMERLQAAKLAKELARARIDRFLERIVLRRRLLDATQANEEIARAKHELEIVRERLERRQREDQTKHLLQERMLWWKLNKSVAKERSVGQRKLNEMETKRRAEQAAMEKKIHTQALKAVAQTNVAELFGTVTSDVVEQTYQARLRSKRKEARRLRKRAAQERIAGFVWQCWTNHLLRKAEQAISDMKQRQEEAEERELVKRGVKALADTRERRAVSGRRISSWLTQQLAQRKAKQRRREETARVEAERTNERLRIVLEQRDLQRRELQAAVENERLRLEAIAHQLEQQRQKEREAEQLLRVQLVQVMMETQKTVDKVVATTLTSALAEYANRHELLVLAARVRSFFVRLLVRKVTRRWRQFTLRRRATKGITTEALWPMEKHRSSRMVASQLMESTYVILELDEVQALRLFELKCIASARKVQRCWRAWNRQLRRQRRLQAKAEEDALIELAKGGTKGAAPTQEALDSARLTIQRWLRYHLRNKRLTWPVKNDGGVLFLVCFRGGRAWVRSRSALDNKCKTRVRFDRGVTRKLLVAAEPAVHSPTELMKLFHTLITDVHGIITHAATSPRTVEKPDGWLEIGDVDEMELPQFCQVTRQLTKTRSIFKRQQLLDAKAASPINGSAASSSACLSIFDAVESASVDDALFLLQQGADLHVREPCHQRTALHMLAFSTEPLSQRLAMLQFLMGRAKLDSNVRDNSGDTPLMLFAAQGSVGLINAMLEFTPHWWRDSPTHSGAKPLSTAMHRACERDQPEAALALQHHGLKHESSPERQRELLLELHRNDAAGMAPLHILASRGHVECIRQLLTPLDTASRSVLLSARDTRRGRSPLHVAIESSQVDAVKMLSEMGADLHATDSWQCSPIHFACRSHHAEELLTLLAEISPVDWQLADERGDTVLHWAAASGHVQVVRQLLVLGADPTVLNNDWETPAQVAASRGHGECLRLLLPATGHSADVGQGSLAHVPVRDVTQELPSPKSYCHPQKGTAPTRKKGEYDWEEIHKDVQLVEESGHFSSEDEGDDGSKAAALGWDSE